MPGIFDELTNNKTANLYAGLPVEETKALNASASSQYKETRQNKDALDIMANNLDVEDRNYEIKKRVIEDVKTKFDGLVKQGNYQDAHYLVQGVSKDILMDNELQGAITSRKNERGYYSNLKDQLDKGEINNDIYSYAIEKTKGSNKGKISYDPNTMSVNGMFSGQGVTKDLSKEIYENMDKRIKDWMPESMTNIDGTQYKKTTASPTGYFNMLTGTQVTESEVKNALRTELQNTGEYRDFLTQEKSIDFHKKFKNEDGSYRDVSKDDVIDLGLSDDKIKTLFSGVSQENLDTLAKSTNKKDKELLEKYNKLRESVNPDNLSQAELKKVYDYAYTQRQTDKYVNPATQKADYELFKDNYLADSFGLENLKHRHRLSEDKAKAELTIQAAPENVSQLQQYKLADIGAQTKTLSEIAKEAEQLQAQLPTATEATKKEIVQRLQVLANKSNIIKQNNSSFEDDMSVKGYDTEAPYINFLGDSSKPGRELSNITKEYRNKLIDGLLSLPANKISSSLSANLQMMKKKMEKNESPDPSMSMEDIVKEINKLPEAKKVYQGIKSSMIERAASEGNKASIIADKGYADLAYLSEKVNDKKVEFLEKEKTKSISTNFIAIDDDNNNKESDEGKVSNKINREVRDQIKSLVNNPSSEFTTESGISIYDIGANSVDGYKLVNSEGKAAKADLTKSKINISSQSIGGKVPVGVTFYDETGRALYFDDETKGQATILAYPKNNEATTGGLRRIGKNYLEHGETHSDKIKGIQYLGNTEYKTQLDTQIAPDFWTEKPKGYTEDVTLNIKGQPVQLKVIKQNTGNGQTEFSIASINSNKPTTFGNLDGKPITTFKSLDEAATVLYYNNNFAEVAPYLNK